jgi:hypothetical protein
MSSRSAEVFFYGLFMDADLLREKGLAPQRLELGVVEGSTLRIAERAALVSAPGSRVEGVVASLTLAELDRLYSEPGVQAYKPQAVLVHLKRGGVIAALCYSLSDVASSTKPNSEYAAKLRAVAQKVGPPPEYVASIL